jgi:hypothetical protein
MDLAKRRKVETFLDVVARSALDASVSVSAVISALVGKLGLLRETAKRLERKAAALLVQLPDTDTATLGPKMHRVCYMCGEWPEYQCKRCNRPFCFECGYTLKDKETGKFFTACDPCIVDTDFPGNDCNSYLNLRGNLDDSGGYCSRVYGNAPIAYLEDSPNIADPPWPLLHTQIPRCSSNPKMFGPDVDAFATPEDDSELPPLEMDLEEEETGDSFVPEPFV